MSEAAKDRINNRLKERPYYDSPVLLPDEKNGLRRMAFAALNDFTIGATVDGKEMCLSLTRRNKIKIGEEDGKSKYKTIKVITWR